MTRRKAEIVADLQRVSAELERLTLDAARIVADRDHWKARWEAEREEHLAAVTTCADLHSTIADLSAQLALGTELVRVGQELEGLWRNRMWELSPSIHRAACERLGVELSDPASLARGLLDRLEALNERATGRGAETTA